MFRRVGVGVCFWEVAPATVPAVDTVVQNSARPRPGNLQPQSPPLNQQRQEAATVADALRL